MSSTSDPVLDLYVQRIESAVQAMQLDIQLWSSPELWETASPWSTLLKHHVEQFGAFCTGALTLYDQQVSGSNDPWERADFRAFVSGMLTARWLRLREAAAQHIPGSPYVSHLVNLDIAAAKYYFRVRNALDKLAKGRQSKQMLAFAPRVCLGRLADITVYNHSVPLILSVPPGAIFSNPDEQSTLNPSRLAIAHEIGHAFLLQFPDFLADVKGQLAHKWAHAKDDRYPRRMPTLHTMMVEWTEEVLADMLGTALAGEAFAQSAVIVMAGSEAFAGITDGTHPPAPVRAFSHAEVIRFLAEPLPSAQAAAMIKQADELSKTADETIAAAQERRPRSASSVVADRVADMYGAQLGRQFKSMSALAFVTLDTVKAELINMTNLILREVKPALFGSKTTVGDFIRACHSEPEPKEQDIVEELIPWGEISLHADEFALELSSHPDSLVAGSRTNEILCAIFGITCSA